MDNNGTAAERSAATPLGSHEQLPAPPPPSTPPPNHASDVLVIQPDGSRDSEDAQPDSLHPLTTMAPSTPHSHAGLPIGRSRSISSISRARSDSLTSSSRHGPTTGNAAPTGSPTQTASRPALPGGAAALVIPNNLSRISVHSLSGASPVSPTQSSATHIGNILAPASFFRPARPSQQGQHHAHQYNTISSARSIPHSIGPAPTGSTSPRNSLALPARPMMPGTSITNSPRKSGAIPDGAIPLTSFAARRASVQSKRMSHGSASASDGDDIFGGTFHSSSLVVEEDPSVQHQQARPMASREPLLTPHEQLSAQQQQQQPSPVASQGMRGSLERIFRRSFSGESLKHSGGVPRTPKTAQTPHSANALIEEPHDEAKSDAPSRHPRFAPLPPRAQLSGVVNPSWMQPILTPSGRPVRNYELHRGANRFFLGGRLMLGGDMPWAFVGTLGVYCIVVGFWMGTTCVYWWHHLSPALAIVGAYMALVTLSSLLATAFRDPGILPRDLDLDAPLPMVSDADSSQPTPLPREIRVRDEVVRTKYCVTCRTYRPPRSSHCRNCDNCVDGCDHHCPWVNNCVGRRNYGSFIICLVSAVTSLILIIVTSAIHLEVLSRREHLDFERTLREGFGSAVTFVAASIVIWPVSILMGYHVRLLYLNTTTIEQVRNKAHKSLGAGAGPLPPNPFTYGRWWYNMAYLLCRPPGYSWIAAEEIATEDKRVRCEVDEEEEDDEDGEEGYDDEQRWSRSVGA